MKKAIVTLLLSVFVLNCFALDGFLAGLQNTAGKKDKLLLVFFKPDCPYCQNMDKVVAADAFFREKITENFNVQVFDITSAAGRLMADKFNVHAVPSMVNFNVSDGDFSIIKGFGGTEKLLSLLGIKIPPKSNDHPPLFIPTANKLINNFQAATCGNAILEAGEQCDDGNVAGGDGCNAVCNVEPGFNCTGSPSVCSAVCGDGIVVATESCDDGNLTGGDGCNAVCNVEPGFNCSGTPSVCSSVCGDGIVASAEGCDDGNATNGDGCSATCNPEPGYICTGSPSSCTSTPPANNECAGAINLTGTSGTANGQNETATNSAAVPVPTCQSNINKDVWYQFTLASTKNIRLEANGPSVTDPVLVIYSGNCASLTQVACDDDNGPGAYSLIQATLNAGTYYVRVGTYNATATGTFSLVYNLNLAGICGNNIIEAGEQCDDGNTANGDNCSSTCQVENLSTIKGVSVNEDATPAHPSAMLDVKSFERGVLIPRMNSSQRTAIAAPAKGLMVFDNTTNTFWYYNGTSWTQLGGTSGATGSGLPAGTANQTLRNDGTNWVANSALQNDGTNVTVTGQVKISGGSPAAGKVLTSDASGLGSWASATYDSSRNTGFGAGNQSAQSFSATFIPTAPLEFYDDGNNFASNVFTVPVTGFYQFTSGAFFNLSAVSAQTTLRVMIETVGFSVYGENSAIIPAGYTGFYALQAVANAKLTAGTQMRVRILVAGSPGSQNLASYKFEGYRIY